MKNTVFKIQTESDSNEYTIDELPMIPPIGTWIYPDSLKNILGKKNYNECIKLDSDFDGQINTVKGFELEKDEDGRFNFIIKIDY